MIIKIDNSRFKIFDDETRSYLEFEIDYENTFFATVKASCQDYMVHILQNYYAKNHILFLSKITLSYKNQPYIYVVLGSFTTHPVYNSNYKFVKVSHKNLKGEKQSQYFILCKITFISIKWIQKIKFDNLSNESKFKITKKIKKIIETNVLTNS